MTAIDADSPEYLLQPAAPALARWRKFVTLPNILTLIFVLLCGTFIFRHALWRDEAQAWLIARDSHSLGELFWNLRYEGHPALWHILLWLITRIFVNPIAMQVLHLLLASATVYIVTRYAPLPMVARILFPFGYFPLFEYGIISRNYQLILLLGMAVCALWQARRNAYIGIGLLLGLLALSHVQGVILAAAFGKMFLFDALASPTGRALVRKRLWQFCLGIVLAGSLTAWSVKSLIPPDDYAFARGWQADIQYEHNLVTWYTLWNGLVPISVNMPPRAGETEERPEFWNNNIVRTMVPEEKGLEFAARWDFWLGVALLAMVITSWRAVLFFEMAAIGLLLFAHLKLTKLYDVAGGTRHHGAYFIAVLMACWIAWRGQARWPADWPQRVVWLLQRGGLVVLLAVHVFAVWVPLKTIWSVPFSMSWQTVEAVKSRLHPNEVLVCPTDYMAALIAAYLPGHPIFLTDEARWGSFAIWRQITTGRQSAFAAAQRIARERHESVVIIQPYSPQRFPGTETLCEMGKLCVQGDEMYFLYRVPAPEK